MGERLSNPTIFETTRSWQLPFSPVKSWEFLQRLKVTCVSNTGYYPVRYSRDPGAFYRSGFDPEAVTTTASLAGRLILPHAGSLAKNLEVGASPDAYRAAVVWHGFACAQFEEIGIIHNYFTKLITAMQFPGFAIDWSGYNSSVADAKLFETNLWMTEIDHYPYILLQVLNQLVNEMQHALAQLDPKKPLELRLVGHSVGARSLLVAASLDGGMALKRVEQYWSEQLDRPVYFLIDALEPAFGLPKDRYMESLRIFDFNLLKRWMKVTPSAVIGLLRAFLSMLTSSYGLTNEYPFSLMLDKKHLAVLVSHPEAIRQPPETKILSPEECRARGLDVVVILAGNDQFVSNAATQKILAGNLSNPDWEQYRATIGNGIIDLQETDSYCGGGMSVVKINKISHIPEILFPDVIAKITEEIHRQQSQVH